LVRCAAVWPARGGFSTSARRHERADGLVYEYNIVYNLANWNNGTSSADKYGVIKGFQSFYEFARAKTEGFCSGETASLSAAKARIANRA
jgi:hypothetical protein